MIDLYDLLAIDSAHTTASGNLGPGVYLSDPQGHALLVGDNGRVLTVLDMGGVVSIGGIETADPEVVERLADRLHWLAIRMRNRKKVEVSLALSQVPAQRQPVESGGWRRS